MSKNITLMGASYSNVPSVLLPKTGGGTASFVDITDTTATASDVASGKYFYTAAGVRTAGTSAGADLSAAYSTCQNNGATMPATQDAEHLSACIQSIVDNALAGSY